MRRSIALLLLIAGQAAAGPTVIDDRIVVDQAGYRPADPKVAVLSEPLSGYDAPNPYTPSATLEVRRDVDDSVAWSGAPAAWGGGAEHAQSGDRVWWLDFSSLVELGSFYVWDPIAGFGSTPFTIADEVYVDVLKQAVRTYYYQRCGHERLAVHARASWADSVCHLETEQDLDCRSVADPTAATSRDLSGGWHDAGDYNKYVNFADGVVHDLLLAYESAPTVWGDDYELPESGNCVPDLLDELIWELDWFMRMQLPDGSVLHKVSVTDFAAGSPPSTDSAPRRYAPATASATISLSGALAHAAIVYQSTGDPVLVAYAAELEASARAAWAWIEANPGAIPSSYDNAGFANAAAEDPPYEQAANRVCAAVYLFARTGETTFRDFVDGNYDQVHLLQWGFAYPFEGEYQDCLLYYVETPAATASVVADITSAWVGSVSGADNLGHWRTEDDAYRAYLSDGNYTWGSNRTKSHQALMYLDTVRLGLDAVNDAEYRAAAAGYLHYLHGVNPTGLAYLTNMSAFGIERSVNQFYHSWFTDGSDWDEVGVSLHGPAPGFLPGGPNPSFAPDPSYGGPPLEPPMSQPIQKSYRDWNTNWPENSWEVTENSITYQSAYVRLLAAYASDAGAAGPPASPGNSLRGVRAGGLAALSWTAAAGATSYEVLRCDATPGACAPAAHETTTSLGYTDAAPPGVDYWYGLRAVNGCGSVD